VADFSIKAHDTMPAISATLSTANGTPVDLTNATSVKFIMAASPGGAIKVAAAATINTPKTLGQVTYQWIATDTATPGTYQAEWEVTWASGGVQTFPTLSYHTVAVVADLENA
jgi:hypothetical protein